MALLSKAKILELLEKGPFDIDKDRSLLSRIGEFLKSGFDPEVVAKTEEMYNSKFSKLVPLMLKEDRVDFADAVPEELSWLSKWMYATRFSEAPGSYHMMSALVFASVLLDGKTMVDMGSYKVYPPIAAILVGPSGNRKNSAITISREIIDLCPDTERLRVVQEKITPEALFQSMNQSDPDKSASAILIAPELSVTLGKQSYLTGLVPLLTRLMDHEELVTSKTRSGGELVAYNVGFAMLGGTTEDWITGAMTQDVIKGGFTSRILFAVEPHTMRASLGGNSSVSHVQRITALVEDLILRITEAPQAKTTIEHEAHEFLENWYLALRLLSRHSPIEESYFARKHVHVLRLAMVLCYIEGDYIIKQKHLTGAMKILEYLEPGMFDLFRRLAAPQSSADGSVLIGIIQKSGGDMSRRALIKAASSQIPLGRIKEALECIVDAGLVYKYGEGDKQAFKLPSKH